MYHFNRLDRRSFLKSSAFLVVSTPAISSLAVSSLTVSNLAGAETTLKKRPKKAVLGGLPTADDIAKMQALGLDGMELCGKISPAEAEVARKIADATGFRFHSLMGGGSAERLEIASILGADAVLIVPGRVSGVNMPKPWEFKITFDEKTNRLVSVIEGDNAPYADYIEAHNAQMESARRLVESLIPTAEKLGIVLGLENVWNNMWVHPEFAANFVLSFDSPWVQAYFDVANNVKYYPRPQDWFDAFKGKVIRVHIKDFLLNADGHGGRFARIMEGSVDWVAVSQKMAEWNYDRWITVELEGCPLTLEEQARRMDLILNEKLL